MNTLQKATSLPRRGFLQHLSKCYSQVSNVLVNTKPINSPQSNQKNPKSDGIKQVRIQKQKKKSHPIVVIGGSAIDMYISPVQEDGIVFGRTNQGKVRTSYGGVGRNITECIARLGGQPAFVTALGMDNQAENILSYMKRLNVQTMPIRTSQEVTGRYIHVMGKEKDILFGISDMKVNDHLTFKSIHEAYFKEHQLQPETIVQLDATISPNELKILIPYLNQNKVRIFYQGIGKKCLGIFQSGCLDQINQLKMNRQEFEIVSEFFKYQKIQIPANMELRKFIASLVGKKSLYRNLARQQHRATIFTKNDQPLQAYLNGKRFDVQAVTIDNVSKTNGAGDTLTGAIAQYSRRGESFREILILGMCASKITIEAPIQESTISNKINSGAVELIRKQQLQY